MPHRLLLLPFLFLTYSTLNAQCGATVDAGPDIIVCASGDRATLNGTVLGPDVVGVEWSPATGLDDPNSLSTGVTITGPRTYTLTATIFDPTRNEITNGDFSNGFTGFTSQYIPGTGGPFGLLSNEGQYAIASNTRQTHTNFNMCPDHTGGGDMLVVNGATTAGEQVLCQTVAVTPNTDYIFNAWLQSAIGGNPALLQFTINGEFIGAPFRASNTPCVWNQFNETYNTGAATSAEICIVNQNTNLSGNDFALDDLFFGPLCEQTDEVTVDFIDLEATAPDEVLLDCNGEITGIDLDGTASSSGVNISYSWNTFNGNITAGANTSIATVNTVGTYTLEVIYDDGNSFCLESTEVEVVQAPNDLVSDPTALGQLNCLLTQVQLSTGTSSGSGTIFYDWSTLDGVIAGPTSTDVVTVTTAGTYTLLVTDVATGCTMENSLTITNDNAAPTAAIVPPARLDCGTTTLNLDGTPSTGSNALSYAWSTTDGSFASATDIPTPTVDGPGIYRLVVTDQTNGCTDEVSVTVEQDPGNLVATLAVPQTLNCNRGIVGLDATGSSDGAGLEITWTTVDGHFVDTDGLMASVDSGGVYTVSIRDPATGCSVQESLLVIDNRQPPPLMLAITPPITCTDEEQIVDAAGSMSEAGLQFRWRTPNGNFTSGTSGPTALVDAGGLYILTLTDTRTGCVNVDSVTVVDARVLPLAEAGADTLLTCALPQLNLRGNAPPIVPGFGLEWQTDNGNLVGDNDELQPAVDAPGTYIIMVTDSTTGCVGRDTVVVGLDTVSPTLALPAAELLTCARDSIDLTSLTDPGQGPLQYTWSTTDGTIPGSNDGPGIRTGTPGRYRLLLESTDNGCLTERTIRVNEDRTDPVAEAGPDLALDCRDRRLPPNPVGSDDAVNFTYQWTDATGVPIAGAGERLPELTAEGRFLLTITNEDNGCSATDSLEVTTSFDDPTVDAGLDQTIDCAAPTVSLGGSDTETGGTISLSWSTPDGTLSGPADQPLITALAGGIYVLRSVDSSNDCFAEDTVRVRMDTVAPGAGAILINEIDCRTPLARIDASASDNGPGFSFGWETTDGSPLTDPGTLSPAATTPGTYSLIVTNTTNACRDTASVTVTIDTLSPTVVTGPDFRLDCNFPTLDLTSAGSDQGTGFSLGWSGPSGPLPGSQPTVTTPGNYTLSVTNDRNGCVSTDGLLVTADFNPPAVEAGPTDELNCRVTTVDLGIPDAGATDYSWTTPDGTLSGPADQSATSTAAPGLYRLLAVSQDNGCRATDSVRITQDVEQPVVGIVPPAILNCAVTSVELDGAASSQGPEFNYRWSTTDGTITGTTAAPATATNAPGSYQLRVTDGGNFCADSLTVTVTQDTVSPVALIQPAAELNCGVTSLELDGSSSSSGSRYAYSWTGPATGSGPTLPVSSPGSYGLLVTDNVNFCRSEAGITVTQDTMTPVFSLAPPEQLDCGRTTTDLVATTGPGNFRTEQWTFLGSDTDLAGGATATTNRPGTYRFLLVDADNQCRDSATVEVIQDLAVPTVTVADDFDLACTQGAVNLTASAGGTGDFRFAWSSPDGTIVSGQDSNQPAILGAGAYTVRVTNARNNCSAEETVTVAQTLLTGFGFSERLPDCRRPEGVIVFDSVAGGTPPFLYSVDGGERFQPTTLFSDLDPGNYALVVQDANGCEERSSTTLPERPDLELFLRADAEISFGDSIRLNLRASFPEAEIDTIIWTPAAGLSCTDCLTPFARPTQTGRYAVRVESIDGCVAEAGTSIIVDRTRPVYFPTAFSPNGDGVNDLWYPFASSKVVSRINRMELFDRWGERVYVAEDFAPSDPAAGWNGMMKDKPMNPAVFVFYAEVTFTDGSVEVFEGDFTLMR